LFVGFDENDVRQWLVGQCEPPGVTVMLQDFQYKASTRTVHLWSIYQCLR